MFVCIVMDYYKLGETILFFNFVVIFFQLN